MGRGRALYGPSNFHPSGPLSTEPHLVGRSGGGHRDSKCLVYKRTLLGLPSTPISPKGKLRETIPTWTGAYGLWPFEEWTDTQPSSFKLAWA